MELVELKVSDKENSIKYKLLSEDKEVAHGYIFNRETNPIEIYVEQDYQSNGYGKLLFTSLLNVLKNKGLKGAIFQLDENNYKIINIIKNAGGVEIGRNLPVIKFLLKF